MTYTRNRPDKNRHKFSKLAINKLSESGISEKDAAHAGMYSVENARVDVDAEFSPRPALVIPYFDLKGEPIQFDREGTATDFVRVRYLDKQNVRDFTGKKLRRYAQMKGSGVHPYFPKIFNWHDIAQDIGQAIIITEGELKALAACCRDYPTIGLGGVDSFVTRQEGSK